jgi:carbon monoxide dehydrogenase subunit G
MRLENRFTIPVPVRRAWEVLLDIERIAPCVPGAAITSRDGDAFHGRVKVKLGPIGVSYNGTVAFVSLDERAGVAVMEAAGRETRGSGTAKAVVTCRLTGQGDSTDVLVDTDLAITGKPAQFGRGVLADVSTTLIGQFAANLAEELAQRDGDGDGGDGTGESSPAPPAPAAPIDLLQAAGNGGPLKHIAPVIAAAALLLIVLGIRRQRSSSGRSSIERPSSEKR